MSYRFIPTRLVNVCQCQALDKDIEQREYAYESGGSRNWCNSFGKKFGIPCEIVP